MNIFQKSFFLVCSIILIGSSSSEKLNIFFDEDEETCTKDELGNCKTDREQALDENPNPDNLLIVPDELAPFVDLVYHLHEDKEKDPEIPFFVDLFGYKYNWTDLNEGWTEYRRKQFFREHRRNSEQAAWMPSFTKLGYKKMKMPKELHQYILDNRMVDSLHAEQDCTALFNCDLILKFNSSEVPEKGQKAKKYIGFIKRNRTMMMNWRDEEDADKQIDLQLKPILESWIGGKIPLNFTRVYGVRRYLNGTSLGLHLDKPTTHVISAILQIDQDVEEDWPLTFIDFNFKKKKIFLKPGEMLLYESSKAPHGRQYPLKGKYFDNVFVHYKPAKKWYVDADFPVGSDSPRSKRKIYLKDLMVD